METIYYEFYTFSIIVAKSNLTQEDNVTAEQVLLL